jgi:hypothetical protein
VNAKVGVVADLGRLREQFKMDLVLAPAAGRKVFTRAQSHLMANAMFGVEDDA